MTFPSNVFLPSQNFPSKASVFRFLLGRRILDQFFSVIIFVGNYFENTQIKLKKKVRLWIKILFIFKDPRTCWSKFPAEVKIYSEEKTLNEKTKHNIIKVKNSNCNFFNHTPATPFPPCPCFILNPSETLHNLKQEKKHWK